MVQISGTCCRENEAGLRRLKKLKKKKNTYINVLEQNAGATYAFILISNKKSSKLKICEHDLGFDLFLL